MSRCFTYGESRLTTITLDGALVTLSENRTACGEWSEDATDPPPDPRARRPRRTCPRCFAAWREAYTNTPEDLR